MPALNPYVRASIGLIIPSSNRLTEPQFHRYCPPGVEPHAADTPAPTGGASG